MIARELDIKVGDTVYAATKSGFLDTPRVIGEISDVKDNDNEPLLRDITVKPIQSVVLLKYVAVIVMEPQR